MSHLLDDPYLKDFAGAITGRARRALDRAAELTDLKRLADWANAHEYFGLHRTAAGDWVFREWAPHATSMWLVGDFNGWKIDPAFELFRLSGSDTWERVIPASRIKSGDKYHLRCAGRAGAASASPPTPAT